MPYQTGLDNRTADCPFHPNLESSITFLPLGSAINRVPPKCFQIGVVVIALGVPRQQGVSLQGTYGSPGHPLP